MALQGFDKTYYLDAKLAALQAESPASWGNKTAADLETLLTDNVGLTPEMHYSLYGYKEGLAPNDYFNHTQYRLAKAMKMVLNGQSDSTESALSLLDNAWTGDLYEHYTKYGAAEGINPSDNFDESTYLTDKLATLKSDASTAAQWGAKTIDNLRVVIKDTGMNVISHYIQFGASEGLTVTTVPDQEKGGDSLQLLPHSYVQIPSDLQLEWVDDTEITTSPHKAIGQVEVVYGQQANLGTGFMISPEHVLTNAHVVLDDNGELDSSATITFAPGLSGDTAAATYEWQKIWTQSNFESDNLPFSWPDNDLAIIKLDQQVDDATGFLSMESTVNLSLINTPLRSAGYSAADIQQDNPATPGQDYYQWAVSGTVDKYLFRNGALDLSEDMNISGGGSGSPLYYTENGTTYFTGVMSGVFGTDPVAAAIDTDSYNWILGILQQDGYYI